MMSASKSNVLKLLSPLLIVGYVGGTISTMKVSKYHKLYASGLIPLHILGYFYLCYGKGTPFFEDFSFLVIFSDQIVVAFLVLSCLSCIISAFYINSKNFARIINNFVLFDQLIVNPIKIKYLHFYLLLIFGNIEILTLLSADTWIWMDTLGIDMYSYYFPRNFQIYFTEMKKILIYWITVEICSRHNMLIILLKNTFCLNHQKQKIFLNNHSEIIRGLKMISNLHNRLCDTSDMLSQLYGVAMVFDILFAITVSIEYSILMISLSVFKDQVLSVNFGVNLMSVCCLWIGDSFVST